MSATSKKFVAIGPGQTVSTVIPRGRSSSPSDLENADTYALVAEYTVMRGVGANEAIELTLRIPAPRSIYGMDSTVIAVSARQLRSTIPACSAQSASATGPNFPYPALLISSTICGFETSNSRRYTSKLSVSVRSSDRQRIRCFANRDANVSSFSRRRATNQISSTSGIWLMTCFRYSSPSPQDAPVITAVFMAVNPSSCFYQCTTTFKIPQQFSYKNVKSGIPF